VKIDQPTRKSGSHSTNGISRWIIDALPDDHNLIGKDALPCQSG
jgi:hypothetical protein